MTIDRSGPDASPVEVSIVSGSPTPVELAAVTAVVLTALAEAAAADELSTTAEAGNPWQRSSRQLRAPLAPARGAWRGFSP